MDTPISREVLTCAIQRLDDLRDAESIRVNGQMELRDKYAHDQAELLANQVSASAETLRVTAAELSQQSAQFNARLASLEKSQYESRGSGMGMRDMWGWIVAVLTIASGIVYTLVHK